MLIYDIDPKIEAFSTNITDDTDFLVVLPLHQAHGTKSVIVDKDGPQEDTYGADALITNVPDVRIGVKTADCVPILLYDPKTRVAAAIHSGWKGTVANIAGVTIKRMIAEFGVEPHNLKALIGPCIHIEAFEVGDEVYSAFSEAGYNKYCRRMPNFDTGSGEKWHIDLPGICKSQLSDLGVDDIQVRKECTYTQHNEFFSARRLGKNFGSQRILSCIRMLD